MADRKEIVQKALDRLEAIRNEEFLAIVPAMIATRMEDNEIFFSRDFLDGTFILTSEKSRTFIH